jgi:transaldolase
MGKRIYKAYCDNLASLRWQRAFNAGARPQRLLMASTGTKDPKASDILYVRALSAPWTVDTMPEATLNAFADHGELDEPMPRDGGDCESMLSRLVQEGIGLDALAEKLQIDGAASFSKSWTELLSAVEAKSAALQPAHT